MKTYYVYMVANWTGAVLYTGVTNNLERRMVEHKAGTAEGFTKKYRLGKLVYFETTVSAEAAIAREKQIKRWRRDKKDALVNALNPEWRDLAEGWHAVPPPAVIPTGAPQARSGGICPTTTYEDPSAALGMTGRGRE